MIQEWLKKSESIPRKHGLYRMEVILEALGNPERELKSIHIAGTNGKGSTAAMVTAFAKAHGLRVGTFTSPHMDSIRGTHSARRSAPRGGAVLASGIGRKRGGEPLIRRVGSL